MTYTHGHHESVLRSHNWRIVDNSAAYLALHLMPGASVIDVGCEPGTITADIGRRVAPGLVLGIDASGKIIEDARSGAGGGPNVTFFNPPIHIRVTGPAFWDGWHAGTAKPNNQGRCNAPGIGVREIHPVTKVARLP